MASRNLNKVILIGNLTRDPELRFTPQGNAVASFVVATNREWTVQGERKQTVDFHNIVAWNKLGEICGQLLKKGIKVYVEGRLQTRDWMDKDGKKKYKTEVIIEDMIILSPKRDGQDEEPMPEVEQESVEHTDQDIDLDNLNLDDLDSAN